MYTPHNVAVCYVCASAGVYVLLRSGLVELAIASERFSSHSVVELGLFKLKVL